MPCVDSSRVKSFPNSTVLKSVNSESERLTDGFLTRAAKHFVIQRAYFLNDELMREPRMIGAATTAVLTMLLSARASMQAPTPSATWQGWLQCQVASQAAGYADLQTHTWTISGPPMMV